LVSPQQLKHWADWSDSASSVFCVLYLGIVIIVIFTFILQRIGSLRGVRWFRFEWLTACLPWVAVLLVLVWERGEPYFYLGILPALLGPCALLPRLIVGRWHQREKGLTFHIALSIIASFIITAFCWYIALNGSPAYRS
jgi:hypothetical protein